MYTVTVQTDYGIATFYNIKDVLKDDFEYVLSGDKETVTIPKSCIVWIKVREEG